MALFLVVQSPEIKQHIHVHESVLCGLSDVTFTKSPRALRGKSVAMCYWFLEPGENS